MFSNKKLCIFTEILTFKIIILVYNFFNLNDVRIMLKYIYYHTKIGKKFLCYSQNKVI